MTFLRKYNNKKHFTLIELIAVMTVLAVLVALGLPKFTDYIETTKTTKKLNEISMVQKGVDMYSGESDSYPTVHQPKFTNEKIDWKVLYPTYIDQKPKYPDDEAYYVDPRGIVFLNYTKDASVFTWLKESKFIIQNPSDSDYKGSNPPIGGVLLNYNTDNNTFSDWQGKMRILTLSTAMTGNTLLNAYKITKDESFLNKAKMVGDYLKNKIYASSFYGSPIYLISPETCYSGGNWQTLKEESYSKDLAISSSFLIKLSSLSEDSSYANEGKKLLDTLCYIQYAIANSDNPDYQKINGALPELFSGVGISWQLFPMDIAYMIYDAGHEGYNYFNDSKYLNFSNQYFSYIENSFEKYNGLSSYGFPYEYMFYDGTNFYGVNQNQDNDNKIGKNEPFTTDQFFYITLGLIKNHSGRSQEMYNLAQKLVGNNNCFSGQYNVDGTDASPYIEYANTAFYLEMIKHFDPTKVDKGIDCLFRVMSDNTNTNSNGGLIWAAGEKYIESLASAIAIDSIIYQP